MKFGVREICDVTFKALQNGKMGSMEYKKGQPVLFIDSAKTSTIEGAATPVYATGGRGNSRLLSWEGEKTLTFTVEDALLSPVGFAVLSGANLIDDINKSYQVHKTEILDVAAGTDGAYSVDVDYNIHDKAPVFVMAMNDGSIAKIITQVKITGTTVGTESVKKTLSWTDKTGGYSQVFVDYYTTENAVTELSIDAENFAGYYYVEASTLFRRESDGKDLPAEIVFPKVKIQSNFTFAMASTGDPSTFTFTMDAMPAYTWFDGSKKVLCAIQVIDDTATGSVEATPVTTYEDTETPIEDLGLGAGNLSANYDSVQAKATTNTENEDNTNTENEDNTNTENEDN